MQTFWNYCKHFMQIVSWPYIYWVCWRSEYLTGLWGFVGDCGDAGLALIAGFSPTLHLVPSPARALLAGAGAHSAAIAHWVMHW